ncbi:MAG TPA: PepSY-associated TM helix domain-containing protein [Acidobacteriaceae bacterium]|nr:PepSY-associated TM helix domain-containing protein [Acidobacteriaceae bacterium]
MGRSVARRSAMAVRRYLTWQHRWTGLLMSAILFVAALTGPLLAFNSELERLISRQLFAVPKPGVVPLDFATLAGRTAEQVPHGRVRQA